MSSNPALTEARAGISAEALRRAFIDHVEYTRGKNFDSASLYDRYLALALTVRDRLAKSWVKTQRRYYQRDVKRAYYLSAEYLLGRALGNNLINMVLWDTAREAMRELGVDLTQVLEMEQDAGLG